MGWFRPESHRDLIGVSERAAIHMGTQSSTRASWRALGRPSRLSRIVRAVPEVTTRATEKAKDMLTLLLDRLTALGRFLFDQAFGILFFLVVVAFVVGAGFAAVLSSRSDGRMDFCYIEVVHEKTLLKAHRPWRPPEILLKAGTFDQAVEAAHKIECPLR